MSNTIRTRIEKLERQPRAVAFRPTIWHIATLLRSELRAMAAHASPPDRAVALEILQISVDRQKTLADVSDSTLDLLMRLLEQRIAQGAARVN